ncbi:gamma-glutamyltransferase family protein [Halomicroarcula sp. S1AR25-4]|uniref:gamma-glutamyltransferase family protein n=1 Tax=Haloarcula sp. S1AR25-4 TaxID=2950538 RepID=UPI0028754D46|nr:gamma-glutamyltransferase family protein [Halomicroarcula sp. S1AR25-4]MDS0278858.1 gamma-glutamyltransferase family protein [Halomicroarcula sp. S1AR25-4]
MDSQPNLDRFTSRRSTAYGTRGVVATSQPLAAEAGIEVLREGGNAFDAAVATAATLNVVEPMSTGLGGDAFALYRTAEGDVGAMRACGGAPDAATLETVRERVADHEGCAPADAEMPDRGPLTVTVPGAPRGWEATVERFGRLSMDAVLDDAVHYATEGFPVSEVIASAWALCEPELRNDAAREQYLVDGERAPEVGEQMRLPELGETLETLAKEGAGPFYEGDIADAIAETVQSAGGLLERSDLAGFEVEFPDPVSTTYGGVEVYELPPNNQGLVALEALNVAEAVGVPETDDPVERTHLLAEATKLAFTDGHHYITDPAYEDVPPLESKQWAERRAEEVGSEAIENAEVGMVDSPAEDADTVLLTVADGAGNVVSFINSLFNGFGSGLVAGETGLTLQNRGASFSLDADHPNRLEPGKRPFHTLIPGLARFGEDDWAAFGVMGGYMQPQGHVQVLSNLLDREMPLQAALDEPRWRYCEDGTLATEARFDEDVTAKLVRRGHEVRVDVPLYFGGAQIARYEDGTLSGATEPRKDGTVDVF